MALSVPILVVTSQPAGIRGLRTALKLAGIASTRLQTAAPDALSELLRARTFELAVLEDTEELDASKLVKRLRRWKPLMPVVIITAAANAKRWKTLGKAGAIEVLSRRQLKAELPVALQRALSGRATASQIHSPHGRRSDAILATAPVVIWALDVHGVFTLQTGTNLEAAGMEAGTYLGRSIFELFSGREDILEPVRRALAGEECTRVIENRGVVTETRYTAQRDAGGKIVGMIGVSTVITEHYQAEQLLRETQARLTREIDLHVDELRSMSVELQTTTAESQTANAELLATNEQLAEEIRLRTQAGEILREQAALLDLAHDAIIVCDFEDRIRYWNRGAERLYGYDRHEAVGRNADELLQTHYPESISAVKAALERDGVFESELEQTTADGSSIVVDSRWAVQRDWRGDGVVYLQINRDIAARKQAEAALRESELRFRQLADAAFEGLVVHDKQSILDVNSRLAEMVGYEARELIGKSVLNFIAPYARELLRDVWRVDGEKPAGEIALLHRGGWEIPVETMGRPLMWRGQQARVAAVRDISARKRAEEALQQAAGRLELAQQAAGAGTWDWELATKRLDWSPQLFKMFGLDPQTAVASFESWEAVLHPADRDVAHARIDQALREHTSLNSEYRIIGPDGQVRWINALGMATYDEQGQPLRMSGLCIDITARRRMEQELRASEERIRLLFETMTQGVTFADADGRPQAANAAAERILGVTLAQMQTRDYHSPDWKILREDGSEFPRDELPFAVAKRTGKPVTGVVLGIYNPALQEYRWHIDTVVPQFDASGTFLGTYSVFTDFTDRKRIEEALREREELFHGIFEEAAVGIVLADVNGGIMDVNPAFREILGYSREEARGLTIEAITHPDDFPITRDQLANLVSGGIDHFHIEKRYLCKDGGIIHGNLTAFSIREAGGKLLYLTGMIEDITRRKEAEEALRRAKEAYQILVENQSELICKCDTERRLLFASRSYCEAYGLDPAASLQQHDWMPTIHEDDREHVRQSWETTLRPPYTSYSEQRELTVRGWRWQAWSNQAVLDEQGHPVAIVSVGRDITERKRLEGELRESEERYRRLVQAAPVPMTVFRRGRIAFINTAGLALLGVADEAAMIGARVRQFIHPEDIERVNRVFREAQRARRQSEFLQFRLIRPDGAVRYVEAVGTELDYLGAPALQAVIRDVTEEKRAQAALVESEDRFRKLAEASFEGILFHDEGEILEVNSHLLQMFGYEAADLAAKSLPDLVVPEHAEFVARRIRARYSDSYEVRGRRRDGSIFPLEVLDRAINWQGRQVRVAALRDISQRREMEYALRESEERYRRLVQESPSAIFVTSEGRIVFANRAAMQLFDARQEEEVLGLAYMHLIAPESRSEVEAALTRMSRLTTDFPTLQYKLLRRDGNRVEVEGRPISFTFQGRDSVLHVSYDITERKRAEEMVRRHSEELERLVAERTAQIQKLERLRLESEKQVAIGRMAARIAHEINNPLAGIKNSFLLVKRGIAPDFKYYEFVGRIEKEIERVARIVRQMFELYRPERKEPTEFRPADVIRDVAALLEGNCRNQGVAIELEAGEAQAPVLLHEDSLRQVLFNLVQNAIEASPSGSRIRITATTTETGLTVTISDQGCGIPEDVQSRIFEPFFTTKSGLTTGGLGLGLSTTKGLIEAMGGTLSYESVVGQGTSFQITLPISEEQSEVIHA